MCGIGGFVEVIPSNNNIQKLTRMNDAVVHRGPDAEGYFLFSENTPSHFIETNRDELMNFNIESRFNLCHRRLSIIDLKERSHQPLTKHGLTLVYNGEIYNYLEIKDELIGLGVDFETTSDSEVILSAYHCWGSDCVKKFNGMWAFAIFEHSTETLFLSRDRFGIKPLVYFDNGQEFIFGSEIKQLLAYGIEPIANLPVLYDFLVYDLSHHTDESFFQNIRYLKPSHNLTVRIIDNKVSITLDRYYEIKFQRYGFSFERLKIEVQNTLKDSVRLRLRSDVKVGSCLSGGLDSSTIVALAANIQGVEGKFFKKSDFETFTSYHDDPAIDETYYSNLVNEFTNSNSNKTTFSVDQLSKDLDRLIYHQEEPFDSFSIYGGYQVMKKAALSNVKVLLDGQGGDEVFLGYEIYYVELIRTYLKRLQILKLLKLFKEIQNKSKLSSMDLLKYYFYFNNSFLRNFIKRKKRVKYLNNNYHSYERKLKSVIDPKSNYVFWSSFKDLYNKNLFKRIQHLLHYEDRNSMSFSIETRLPFLDYRLVNIVSSVSSEDIFSEYWLKGLLRKSVDSLLPAEITYRKTKFGFPAPEEELLNSLINQNGIGDLLELESVQNLFNVGAIKEIFENKTNTSVRLKFYLVSMWIKKFNVRIV
jgi:asparagine synthase (glutamine-hydrolysing)